MNREEYLKKLKESVENGKVDEDLTSHHYAILNKAEEKTAKVKADLQKQTTEGHVNNEERLQQIREEGRPSPNDRLRINTENGGIEHVEIENIDSDFLTSEERHLKKYAQNINEILGEDKVAIKNGDIVVDEKRITADQITKERVIREIVLLEEENQRCYSTISRNNDLLTYLKIELNTL